MSDLRSLLETAVDTFNPTEEHLDRTIRRAQRRQRRHRIAATAMALVVAGAGIGIGVAAFSGGRAAQPAGTPLRGDGLIAFARLRDGVGLPGPQSFNVYTVGPNGQAARLTHLPAVPVWSPSGRQIAYAFRQPGQTGGGPRLYVANADGSHARQVPTCEPPSCYAQIFPSWSPDGLRIAFSGTYRPADGGVLGQDVYVVNGDGSGLIRLTNCVRPACASDWFPTWSPSGMQIAYWAVVKAPTASVYHRALQILELSSGKVRTIYTCQCDPQGLAWSPTDDRILFVSKNDIAQIRADGTGFRRLTTCPGQDPHCGVASSVWSPDGRFIAFSWTPASPGLGGNSIWVMNADGTGPRQVTHPPQGWGDLLPSWQPIPTSSAASTNGAQSSGP